jgi:AcrR family transcriptional regulator
MSASGSQRSQPGRTARELRPKETAKRAKAETYRRLIMGSGEKVFAEHGFDAAKIQDIAAGAGLSLGTLYSVFPGKTEIYTAIQLQRGSEVLQDISAAMRSYQGVLEQALAGIAAYVRCLVERPDYLRMHLREGLSWTQRSSLRTGEEVDTWERGVALAVQLLERGMESGFFYVDNEPAILLKMMIASHQVQLQDWLDSGAEASAVDGLIRRMQDYFRRAFVAESARPLDPAMDSRYERLSGR